MLAYFRPNLNQKRSKTSLFWCRTYLHVQYRLSKRVLTLLGIQTVLKHWIAQMTSVWRQSGGGWKKELQHMRTQRVWGHPVCVHAHRIPASNDCHACWYYNISPLSKLEVLHKEWQPCRSGKTACQQEKQSTEIWIVGSCGWFLECKKWG